MNVIIVLTVCNVAVLLVSLYACARVYWMLEKGLVLDVIRQQAAIKKRLQDLHLQLQGWYNSETGSRGQLDLATLDAITKGGSLTRVANANPPSDAKAMTPTRRLK